MLEVLTYAAIVRDPDLYSRLHVEPKLFGFSDAGHKVEFVILNERNLNIAGDPVVKNGGEIRDLRSVIGFIECKKVGVEQTVNGRFKRSFEKHGNTKSYRVPYGHDFVISFAPRGFERHSFNVVFENDKTVRISKLEDQSFNFCETISDNQRIIFALNESGEAFIFGDNQSLRDFRGTLKNCRILEILSCEDDFVLALLNDCLAGPQTPEKAKQASFVALDVRKRRFDSFDKRDPENELVSVLVLTEFSHWEQKSQNMIKACIDKNFVIDDQKIIEAFVAFEENFGEDFYNTITKENFERNEEVRQVAVSIVDRYNGLIFFDIEDRTYKRVGIRCGRIAFTS